MPPLKRRRSPPPESSSGGDSAQLDPENGVVEIEDSEDEGDDNNNQSDGLDDSSSSSDDDVEYKDKIITVKLLELRKDFQCPICLGIIRKTRAVMECLHRFCRDCIEQSMRLGNNECPSCRTHVASRRSLRDDPRFDAFIRSLYSDIDKYEAEELSVVEEDKTRNKQIQDTITEISRRQSEAWGRKRRTARATAAAFMRRSRGINRYSRKRNHETALLQVSDNDDNSDDHEGAKEPPPADEPCTEVKLKCYKRSGRPRSQPSVAATSADGDSDENDFEGMKESAGTASGVVTSEMLAWGKGGMRSNSRSVKGIRNGRVSKLLDSLHNLPKYDDKLDVHLTLISLNEQTMPNLEMPRLRCSPSILIGQLCLYIALHTSVEFDKVEILLVKENSPKLASSACPVGPLLHGISIDPSKHELQILEKEDTLFDLQAMHDFSRHGLLLAYQKKSSCQVF